METKPDNAALILPGVKSLVSGIIGLHLAYRSIVVLRGLDPDWGRYLESSFHWLFSGKIIIHRIWFCLTCFTSFIIRIIKIFLKEISSHVSGVKARIHLTCNSYDLTSCISTHISVSQIFWCIDLYQLLFTSQLLEIVFVLFSPDTLAPVS